MQALGLVWGNVDSLSAELEEVLTPLSSPRQYGAKLLLDRWRAREADGGFVVGRDVPSRALACVLRNLALYEPIDLTKDFRIRIAGTAFIRRFGRDITGLKLSEIYDEASLAAQRNAFADVIRTREPDIVDVRLLREERTFLHFEALRLPVLSRDRKTTWVLGGVFYSDWA